MDAGTLHEEIAEVCPVDSVTVGDPDDRETWSFVPGASATPEQIAAGNNVIATIPLEAGGALTTVDFIARFTNAEYRAATAATWRQTGPNAKNWDVVVFEPTIKLSKKKVTTLRDSLIADGILTAQRAAEIFS